MLGLMPERRQHQIDYLLHLADNALVHGQRIAQWCSHGSALEEDIAMANIGLDHIGQARMLYQHAASLIGETTEDKLAYFRNPEQFRNYVLLELPQRTAFAPSVAAPMDYAVTVARNFLYASLMQLVWQALQQSSDAQLAAIAAKSAKEVRYHLRHSGDWLLRLGDGTAVSHAKMQAALDYLMPFTQEFWTTNAVEAGVFGSGVGINTAALKAQWQSAVAAQVAQATLKLPSNAGHLSKGKDGQHSEHLSYLLAEMQSLARAHPEAVW
jgi:ring-1,2-phenylacetyl-CoA epoxidase subunit PaaC